LPSPGVDVEHDEVGVRGLGVVDGAFHEVLQASVDLPVDGHDLDGPDLRDPDHRSRRDGGRCGGTPPEGGGE
jgi:hypothetical protein